jgi:hypothetical protein
MAVGMIAYHLWEVRNAAPAELSLAPASAKDG